MDWLLSFIIITVISFYVLGWVGKHLLRWWLLRKQRQFAEQFGQDGQFSQNGGGFSYTSWGGQARNSHGTADRQRKKEGEVRVEQTQAAQRKVNSNVGDYVEYEEVTETKYEQTIK